MRILIIILLLLLVGCGDKEKEKEVLYQKYYKEEKLRMEKEYEKKHGPAKCEICKMPRSYSAKSCPHCGAVK